MRKVRRSGRGYLPAFAGRGRRTCHFKGVCEGMFAHPLNGLKGLEASIFSLSAFQDGAGGAQEEWTNSAPWLIARTPTDIPPKPTRKNTILKVNITTEFPLCRHWGYRQHLNALTRSAGVWDLTEFNKTQVGTLSFQILITALQHDVACEQTSFLVHLLRFWVLRALTG